MRKKRKEPKESAEYLRNKARLEMHASVAEYVEACRKGKVDPIVCLGTLIQSFFIACWCLERSRR